MVIIRLSDPLAEAFLSCSILFSSSYPPTNEQKEIAEQERRPSHPNANPATFAERDQQGARSDPFRSEVGLGILTRQGQKSEE